MVLHLLLGWLSRRFMFAPDDGAGGAGGTDQGSGTDTTSGAQGAQTTTTGDDTQGADSASDGEGDNPDLVDVTAVDGQGRKLWYSAEEYVKVHQEAAKRRKQYQTLKQQLEALGEDPDAKTDKNKPDPESQVSALGAQVKDLTIQNAVLAEAARQREDRGPFVDPEDAVRLVDMKAIRVDENGTASGVQEAVAALATAKPHLLRKAGGQGVQRVDNPERQGQDTLTREQIATMTPQEINKRKDEVDRVLASEYGTN